MLREIYNQKRFLEAAQSFIGLPYRWGGDDAIEGFDCSGLVVECLKTIGRLKEGDDFTADGLWREYSGAYQAPRPREGAIAFLFRHGRCYHVGICIDLYFWINAGGGGSKTVDNDAAADSNAFVKVRPIPSSAKFVYLFN